MKYVFILIVSSLTIPVFGQANTFPSSGNVGIGTTSPSQELEVVGNSIIGSSNIDAVLNGQGYFQSNSPLSGAGYVATPWIYARAIEGDERGSAATLITIGGENGFTSDDHLGFVTSGNLRMILKPDGKVGIGTSNPSEKLTVNGTTKAKEVIVEENVGADFVFEEDYELPNLSDLETYIKPTNISRRYLRPDR